MFEVREYDECEKYICRNSVPTVVPSLKITLVYHILPAPLEFQGRVTP
jgi:hypothetical protein